MKKYNQVFGISLFLLNFLPACQNPNQKSPENSRPSATATVIAATPSAPVSEVPATTKTALPQQNPSLIPNPSPSPTATASSEPNQVYVSGDSCSQRFFPLKDIFEWVREGDTLKGSVYNDLFQPLDGVKMKIRSLNKSLPLEDEVLTVKGEYRFPCAATGFQIEITASKPGYATRKRIEVLSANHGEANENKYDFGSSTPQGSSFSAPYDGLSDKPEVTQVTPARNGSGVSPTTPFRLRFSEPMDRQSVEDNFTIRGFNNRLLTVDGPKPLDIRTLPIKYTVAGNGYIATNFQTGIGTPIWDKSAFNIAWNADDTEVTFTFKDEKALPTDKNKDLVPDYQVAFKSFQDENRTLKDKTGVERKDKHFKLTYGDFEESYKFSIKTDENLPSITGAKVKYVSNQPANLLLQYSKPMLLNTYALNIAGGMADLPESCLQAPAGYPDAKLCTSTRVAHNYSVKLTNKAGHLRYQGSWAKLGGEANYDSNDITQKTVQLSLAPFKGKELTHFYMADQEILTAIGRYKTGTSSDTFSFSLMELDGSQKLVEVTLESNLQNTEQIAQDLGLKLKQKLSEAHISAEINVRFIPDLSQNPSVVPGQLALKLYDPKGEYLGFFALPTPPANDSLDTLPNFDIGGKELKPGDYLINFEPQDQIEITASKSILDPAGNEIDLQNNPVKLNLN